VLRKKRKDGYRMKGGERERENRRERDREEKKKQKRILYDDDYYWDKVVMK